MWQTSSQTRNQQDNFLDCAMNDQSYRLNTTYLQKVDWRLNGGYPEATQGLPGDSNLIHVNKNDNKSEIS